MSKNLSFEKVFELATRSYQLNDFSAVIQSIEHNHIDMNTNQGALLQLAALHLDDDVLIDFFRALGSQKKNLIFTREVFGAIFKSNKHHTLEYLLKHGIFRHMNEEKALAFEHIVLHANAKIFKILITAFDIQQYRKNQEANCFVINSVIEQQNEEKLRLLFQHQMIDSSIFNHSTYERLESIKMENSFKRVFLDLIIHHFHLKKNKEHFCAYYELGVFTDILKTMHYEHMQKHLAEVKRVVNKRKI